MAKSSDDTKSDTSSYWSCSDDGDHDTDFFKNFRRYDEIQLWLRNLVDKHPNTARLEIIGKSVQNRDIYMVMLKGYNDGFKIAVMLEGGIHAREWISPAAVLYFINYVLLNKDVLDNVDLYVIPCLNPDGYEYTHTCSRLWRKNMNSNGSESSQYWGVDINRNFPYFYGFPGSSSSPTNSMYRGRHVLSEPEAQCLANVLNKYGSSIKLYVAVHAGGNKIMYPWGFTTTPVVDEYELRKCASLAASAVKLVFPTSYYKIGQFSKALYLSSGCSSDYARGMHGIKFSYTIELHRSGVSGFEPCTSEIVPEGKEVVLTLKAMMKYVYNFYKYKGRKKSPIKERRKSPKIERKKLPNEESSNEECSKSPNEECSKSPNEERSKSPNEERSKSPKEDRSKSPKEERSKSPNEERSKSPNEERRKSRNEERRKSRNEERRKSLNKENRKSSKEESRKSYKEESKKSSKEERTKSPKEESKKSPKEESKKSTKEESEKSSNEESRKSPNRKRRESFKDGDHRALG